MGIDICKHGGNFGGENNVTLKFANVSSGLTPPVSPKPYDIWLECEDLINHVSFSDIPVDLLSIGDVRIGIANTKEVLRPLIKKGAINFSSTPRKVEPSRDSQKKIMESKILDLWSDVGVAQVKRSDGIHYVNSYFYSGERWIQFGVSDDVGLFVFMRDSTTGSDVYKVIQFDNNDAIVSTQLARWSAASSASTYGFSHTGIHYDPQRKKMIVGGITGTLFEIDITLPLNASTNLRTLASLAAGTTDVSLRAAGRDLIIGLGGYGTTNKTARLVIIDPITNVKVYDNTALTNTAFRVYNAPTDYIENKKVLVNVGTFDGYNNLTAFDLSKFRENVVAKLFTVDFGNTTSYYINSIVVDQSGVITFRSPRDKAFIQYSPTGVELKRVDEAPLGLSVSSNNIAINCLTRDRDGNFYASSFHENGTRGVIKLDQNFNEIWRTSTAQPPSNIVVAKEGIMYVWVQQQILKISCKSGNVISTVHNFAAYATTTARWTTYSPSMSAFPEYW